MDEAPFGGIESRRAPTSLRETRLMHFRRPRYTILSLMAVVLIAALGLAIFVLDRDHRRRVAAQKVATASALANYLNARLTREAAEIAVTEYTEGVLKSDL